MNQQERANNEAAEIAAAMKGAVKGLNGLISAMENAARLATDKIKTEADVREATAAMKQTQIYAKLNELKLKLETINNNADIS